MAPPCFCARAWVHGQRAGLSGLVFYRGHNLALCVEQLQGSEVGDGGELLEAGGEVHGGCLVCGGKM